MKTRMSVWAAAAATAWTGSLAAHHSESMFERTAVRVMGSLLEFERIYPHSILRLEETTADGRTRRWIVEGPDPGRLDGRGVSPDFLHPGDAIGFCAFPIKEEFSSPPPGEPPFVHGHVVTMPDGTMQMWGSYGALRACVRPSDRPQAWAHLLNSNDRARSSWCRRFSMELPIAVEATAVIEEIGRRMDDPC